MSFGNSKNSLEILEILKTLLEILKMHEIRWKFAQCLKNAWILRNAQKMHEIRKIIHEKYDEFLENYKNS
jgi:hypothetical protein